MWGKKIWEKQILLEGREVAGWKVVTEYPRCTLQEKPGKTGFPTDNPEERIISKRNIQEKQVFNGKTRTK